MAGVAPQHRGGSNATTIGMVAAIVVAVLLAGVLIWMFTQQEQLRAEAERATRTKDRLATSSQEAAAQQMFPRYKDQGKTLVGEMNRGLQLVCGRMTGNQNDAPETAVMKLDAVLDEVKEDVPEPEEVSGAYGAVAILTKINDLYKGERAAREEKEAAADKAEADLAALRADNEELSRNFSAELAKMSTKIEELQRGKSDFENVKGDEVRALARQIDDKQDALDSMRRDEHKRLQLYRWEITERNQSIEELSHALAEYRAPGVALAADPFAIARDPIGRVLRALPGDSLVHIDLGRRDKVTLGMTFTVYPADERVGTDGRGKANVEAVSLGERTAECRITTPPSPDDPILPNDRVGNIVLSRNQAKKTRICVVGRFDINGDGQTDAHGVEAIRALSERYGAEIVRTVDATTDYLIVGLEPAAAVSTFDVAEDEDEDDADEDDDEDYDDEDEDEDYDDEDDDEDYDEDEDEDEYDDDEDDDEDYDEDEDEDEDDADEDEDEYDADEDEDDDDADEDEDEDDADEDEDEYDADEDEDEDDADEDEDDDDEDEGLDEDVEEDAGDVGPLPRIRQGVEVDPTAGPRARRALNERERYFRAIRRAEMFAIPRLRQDQFFSFIGIEIGPDAVKRLAR